MGRDLAIFVPPNIPLTSNRFVFTEDHSAGASLQHARHCNLHIFPDVRAASFDDDHRAIVEVADSLAVFFARLHDFDEYLFAWPGPSPAP